MSEQELQNESGVSVEIDSAPVVDQNNGAVLAAASDAEHKDLPPVEESAEDKAEKAKNLATEAINKQHGKYRAEERKVAGLQKQLDDINSKEQARLDESFKSAPVMPIAPTYPVSDTFDEGHDAEVRQYHDDVTKYNASLPAYQQQVQAKAEHDVRQTLSLQNQQDQQQQAAQAQHDTRAKLSNDFFGNATAAGASNDEVNLVVNTLNDLGMSSDLGDAIMSDPDGYYTAKHLAANPMDMKELTSMNPILAGAKLAEIKLKASALKPTTTQAPTPVEQLAGAGAKPDQGKFPNSGGATFT